MTETPEVTGTTNGLFEAVKAGDVATVEALIEREPALVHAVAGGMTPVMTATYYGRREVAELLISKGADVDAFAAAALGNVEQLQRLLWEEPERIKSTSSDGWTPLHLAAHFGQEAAARLLIELDADVHARSTNSMENTPLHAALAGGSTGVARLLLEHGADVNATQSGAYTPLHMAAENGDTESVALLLTHGAVASAVSEQGQTARAMALAKGHTQVAALIGE